MVWFYGISTVIGYLKANPFLYIWRVLFQTIQFSKRTQFKCQKQFYFKLFSLVNKVKWFQVLLCITNNSIKHQSFIYAELNAKTVLFQIIQFCISSPSSFIWPTDRTLSSATTPGQSAPWNDGYKEVLRILQSSSISEASPSDCLESYQNTRWGSLTQLQRCSRCILQPLSTGLVICLSIVIYQRNRQWNYNKIRVTCFPFIEVPLKLLFFYSLNSHRCISFTSMSSSLLRWIFNFGNKDMSGKYQVCYTWTICVLLKKNLLSKEQQN